MSSGPFIPERAAQPLDLLEQGIAGDGWPGLDKLFQPHLQGAPYQPADDVAKSLYLMYRIGGEGRAVIEWLMDITIRMPYRATSETFEKTALLTATRQGINGVGEAVLAAIKHGELLMEQSETQNGAGS